MPCHMSTRPPPQHAMPLKVTSTIINFLLLSVQNRVSDTVRSLWKIFATMSRELSLSNVRYLSYLSEVISSALKATEHRKFRKPCEAPPLPMNRKQSTKQTVYRHGDDILKRKTVRMRIVGTVTSSLGLALATTSATDSCKAVVDFEKMSENDLLHISNGGDSV